MKGTPALAVTLVALLTLGATPTASAYPHDVYQALGEYMSCLASQLTECDNERDAFIEAAVAQAMTVCVAPHEAIGGNYEAVVVYPCDG